MMPLLDKIYGCLAGLALGDALGMPVEFMTREQIRSEMGWIDRPLAALRWHPHCRLQAGQVTDDTGQALAVAHALDPQGRLTAQSVAGELIRWADAAGDTLDVIVGPSTRQALDMLRRGADPRLSGKNGKTNGAAYRAIAVGIVNAGDPDRLLEQVVEACLPTHGTTPAISGAAAVGFAVAAALQEDASLESILSAAQQGAVRGRSRGAWAWSTPLEKRIQLACRLASENRETETALAAISDFVGVDMLVAESVASSFGAAALAEGDPMKAVVYGANLGGDTDTMAAIAGAVCGAWKGISAIDTKMLATIEAVNGLDLGGEAGRLLEMIRRRSKA